MEKRKRNIIIGAGAVTAVLGAVTAASLTVMKKLVGMAMDRPEPELFRKKKSKMAGGNDIDAVEEENYKSECAFDNCAMETAEIQSRDGLRLIGHWYECAEPRRVIVAMHGWRSTWDKDFGAIADFWHSNNCCVLYAEQRAQGASEGEYMGFGMLERYDCLDWVNWVNEKTGGKLPVYLAGISMGASTVLMAAGLELPENVVGIQADCGFTSTHDIWKHVVGSNLHIPYSGIREAYADKLCRDKINMGTKDHSTLEAMAQCKVPVLFIHGENDHFVPVEMTYKNYEVCAAPKRMFIVPEATHGMSYIVDREGYEKQLSSFWNYAEKACDAGVDEHGDKIE